jgi:hypothetical protein
MVQASIASAMDFFTIVQAFITSAINIFAIVIYTV